MTKGTGWSALVVALFLAGPACASGIYVVDDSSTTPAGTGQIESWVSFRGDGSLLRFYPAAAFRALPTVEWTVGLERDRIGVDRLSGMLLQAKARITAEPEETGEVGLSLAAAGSLPFSDCDCATFGANAAVTVMAHQRLRLHANLGVLLPPGDEAAALTWGVRSAATLVPDRLEFHAELFGQSTGAPGFQLGLRPTLAGGRLDLELAFGHNLAGERADWLTLGAAFRF